MSSKNQEVTREEDAMPSVVKGASFSTASTTASQSTNTTTTLEPKLDELPKIVLVDLQKDDTTDVVQALYIFFDLLDDNVCTKLELVKRLTDASWSGAPAMIVLTMRKWLSDEAIQAACCDCLMRLAYYDDWQRSAIVQSGGVEAILQAMKEFPASSFVHMSACAALQNIFNFLGEGPAVPEMQQIACRFVQELDGLGFIVTSMKEFVDSVELQGDSCGLLFSLARKEKFRKALVKAGAMAAVGEALKHHLENEVVNSHANAFLLQLMEGGGLGGIAASGILEVKPAKAGSVIDKEADV